MNYCCVKLTFSKCWFNIEQEIIWSGTRKIIELGSIFYYLILKIWSCIPCEACNTITKNNYVIAALYFRICCFIVRLYARSNLCLWKVFCLSEKLFTTTSGLGVCLKLMIFLFFFCEYCIIWQRGDWDFGGTVWWWLLWFCVVTPSFCHDKEYWNLRVPCFSITAMNYVFKLVPRVVNFWSLFWSFWSHSFIIILCASLFPFK